MVADDASQSSASNCVEGNLMSNDSVTAHHKSFPDVRLVESTRARSAKCTMGSYTDSSLLEH